MNHDTDGPDFADDLRKALALPASVHLYADFFPGLAPWAPWAERLPPQLARANAKRQRAFLAGRYCAARALAEAGFHSADLLGMDADRLPSWPEGWLGSISHAGEGAWAAVAGRASHAALGIDMECLIGEQALAEIQAQVANQDELEILSSLPRAQGLTLLFSAKEALYKALYPSVRQVFDFSAARAVSLRHDALELRLSHAWGAGPPAGTDIAIKYVFRRGYVFTACLLEARQQA